MKNFSNIKTSGTSKFSPVMLFFSMNSDYAQNLATLAFGDMKQPEQGVERKAEEIVVYPNPSQGNINITNSSVEGFGKSVAQIIDLNGRILTQMQIAEGTRVLELSMHQHPAGTYVLSIIDQSGKIEFSKIIELIR